MLKEQNRGDRLCCHQDNLSTNKLCYKHINDRWNTSIKQKIKQKDCIFRRMSMCNIQLCFFT